jgi:hypothetical protein
MFNRGFEEDELSLPRLPNETSHLFHRGETCPYLFLWGGFNRGHLNFFIDFI